MVPVVDIQDERGASPVAIISRSEYLAVLQRLDIAVCEAHAVGQAQVGRMAEPCIGYATYIYARLSSHALGAVRAAPLSRWTQSDNQWWSFNMIAGHARAVLEGSLFFAYLIQPNSVELEESRARIALLQLNDCCSRQKLFADNPVELAFCTKEAEQLRDRLLSIPFFQGLSVDVRSSCLAGKKACFLSKEQQVALIGMQKSHFDTMWNLLSQHAHIHPMSFYRNEPNGRGSGLENDFDRSYLAMGMDLISGLLSSTTDAMVDLFPDVAPVRQGIHSKFRPGPASNSSD